MGACLSSSATSAPSFTTIRLVHFNGYVEDFEPPLAVGQVIGKPPRQFMFTAAQLLSAGSKPLAPETQLEPGRFYFVLPFSVLQNEFSPLDMATMVRRLTSKATSVRSDASAAPPTAPPSTSAISSPDRSMQRPEVTKKLRVEADLCLARGASWKPILDPITEISLT